MKAAVMRGVGQPLTIEEVDVAKPIGREVLVRVAATGVCHSDLHIMEGLYPGDFPCILGHESAGVVEEVGDQVSYFSPGDHVISCLSVFCGHCEACVTGHLVNCERPQDVNRRPRRGAALEPERRAGAPVLQPLLLRRVHARARARDRERFARTCRLTGRRSSAAA